MTSNDTNFPINHPLAIKLWSRKLFQESLEQTWFSKFMGASSDSLIQAQDELKKGPGDMVTIGLRTNLKGEGILGDGKLEGEEESLNTYHFSIIIDQLRHAVRSSGKMSEQRVPFSLREEARLGLQDWWSNRLDISFFNQICGNTAIKDVRFSGNQAVQAASLIVRAGDRAKDTELTKADIISLNVIDQAILKAKETTTMRPIKVNGEEKYVMFLHPRQAMHLRQNAQGRSWYDIQKAALQADNDRKNPLYTGALGEYNGVILHESSRITTGVSDDHKPVETVRRAVLCGAQAAIIAFGQNNDEDKMSWVEESFDYDNQFGVSAGLIYGLKKTQFNNNDFASIVVSTAINA